MLNRRDFLTASGTAMLVGLASLVNDSSASPNYNSDSLNSFYQVDTQDLINQAREYEKTKDFLRGIYLFTYEEWNDFNRYRESSESSARNRKINGPHRVEIKALFMVQNPSLTWGILTKREIDFYQSEVNIQDPIDWQNDRILINQKYSLHLTYEEFMSNPGAIALWLLNRHYSYRYSDEKTRKITSQQQE